MNKESDSLSTPKQTKRLGLRRSSSILKGDATNLTGSSIKTPILKKPSRLAQSDIKINYKGLEQNPGDKNTAAGESTPATPHNANSKDLPQRKAVSSNCRPYRLALSKRIREKMTKKRLEFYLANEIEKESNENQTESQVEGNIETEKILDSAAEKELEAHQNHLKKVEELKQAIAIWKNGFSSALHDLQQRIEPRLETAALLERLRIPQEMIKYVNE